jgi:hypothetical protein
LSTCLAKSNDPVICRYNVIGRFDLSQVEVRVEKMIVTVDMYLQQVPANLPVNRPGAGMPDMACHST